MKKLLTGKPSIFFVLTKSKRGAASYTAIFKPKKIKTMRTIQTNIYQFSELSETAKANAKCHFEYFDTWGNDRRKSYEAAKELYKTFDTEAEISGARLYAFIQNRILPQLRMRIKYCLNGNKYASSKIYKDEKARFSKIQFSEDAGNLTGYCADYSFLKPIFDFLKSPDKYTTSHDLRDTDLEYIWEREAESDYEGFYKDDSFADFCEANEYEFTEDGKMI